MQITGSDLREIRKICGFDQRTMAKRLGINQGHLCRLEKGKRPIPPDMRDAAIRIMVSHAANINRKADEMRLASQRCQLKGVFQQNGKI